MKRAFESTDTNSEYDHFLSDIHQILSSETNEDTNLMSPPSSRFFHTQPTASSTDAHRSGSATSFESNTTQSSSDSTSTQPKTKTALEIKRQNNRESAASCRKRKKQELTTLKEENESLKQQIEALTRENTALTYDNIELTRVAKHYADQLATNASTHAPR